MKRPEDLDPLGRGLRGEPGTAPNHPPITVGRIVHLHPAYAGPDAPPYAAIVTAVHDDEHIDCAVFVPSSPTVHPHSDVPPVGHIDCAALRSSWEYPPRA